MKKIIFLDVDGTLTMQNGKVPKSAITAIQQARNNGHNVYLCTGRSMAEITEDLREIGFDGYIAAGGGYIEKDNKIIKHKKMNKEDLLEIIEYLDKHDVGYYLESNSGIYPSDGVIDKIKETVQILVNSSPELFYDINNPEPVWFFKILEEKINETPDLNNINKMSFVSVNHPFEETYQRFQHQFEVYHATVYEFGQNSGEIGLKNIDKLTAITTLLKEYNQEVMTYAYGDGLNDIAMFEAVDYKVAMNNAYDELKEIADEVIEIAEKDSIYKHFKQMKFI